MFTNQSVPWACVQHNSIACECAHRNFVNAWPSRQLEAELRAWVRLSNETFRRIDEWEEVQDG